MEKNKNDHDPKISVVIPSFNKVKFIGTTLKSIFGQSYKNFEVIVQDGLSTDGSLEIIKTYLRRYPGKIYLDSKKDEGQLDAINKGVKKTTGDIITFINADDYYKKNAFLYVSECFSANRDAFWFAGLGKVVDSKDNEIAKVVNLYKKVLTLLNIRWLLFCTNYLIQPSVFITRTAYEKFGPFTGTRNFIMEYDYWLKLSEYKMPVIINRYLSVFRLEKSAKTKTMTKKILKEDENIIKKYTSNVLILFVHKMNNYGRIIVSKLYD